MIGPLKPKDLRAHALGPPQEPSASGSCGERSRGGMDELLPKAEAKDMELAATRAPFWRSGRRSTSAISNSGTARKPGTVPPVGRVPFGTRQKEPKTCRGVKSRLECAKGRPTLQAFHPPDPRVLRGPESKCLLLFPAWVIDTWAVPPAGYALVPPGQQTSSPNGPPAWGIRLESECAYRLQNLLLLIVFR